MRDGDRLIVVLDRGWVWYGAVTWDDDWITISDALCIRQWGTTRGLGQLALSGPTPSTRLDPAGTVRAPLRSLICFLETEGPPWKKTS